MTSKPFLLVETPEQDVLTVIFDYLPPSKLICIKHRICRMSLDQGLGFCVLVDSRLIDILVLSSKK